MCGAYPRRTAVNSARSFPPLTVSSADVEPVGDDGDAHAVDDLSLRRHAHDVPGRLAVLDAAVDEDGAALQREPPIGDASTNAGGFDATASDAPDVPPDCDPHATQRTAAATSAGFLGITPSRSR